MINKKVAELMNLQINKEFYSAYLYLDMAILRRQNLNGLPTGSMFRLGRKETIQCSL